MTRHTGSKLTAGGLSHEPFFRVFNNIRSRITDPSIHCYKDYGGRGLKFEWKNYMEFKKDMYIPYLEHCKKFGKRNTTIERIDNNGNYCKENCRWATWEEQSKNRRSNRYITYKGRTLIVADWAKELGVSRQTIGYRLRQGWKQKDIIEIPFNHSNKYAKIKITRRKKTI